MKNDRVKDLMTRDVTVIRRDADVHELEKLLLEKRVHGLPVVDEDGALVGVISQTDLLNWHYNTGVDGASFYRSAEDFRGVDATGVRTVDIETATIEEVMSPVVHCIGADRPVAVAASTMIRQRIHRLIVVDTDMRVRGIISALDVLHSVPGVDTLVTRPAIRKRRPPRAVADV